MEAWNELLRVALLGTARQTPSVPQCGNALDGVLSKLNSQDGEGTLLAAAGALSLFSRAGTVLTVAAGVSAPAETENMARCTAQAAGHLSQMLAGLHTEVLDEWLAASAEAGKRVSEEQLPALLDHGANNPQLCSGIANVIGARGIWLARQNDDWKYAATGGGPADSSAAKEVWETSAVDARVLLLQRLRLGAPAMACELIKSTWKEDASDDRARFIATLQIDLSQTDEPLLEECLDDKRKEVRSEALTLLSQLPSARRTQRMLARVKPLLAFVAGKKGMLAKLAGSKSKLEVTLPPECDKSMQRDGIALKAPAHLKFGEKAWWLRSMLEAVPPATWSQAWSAPPDAIIAAAEKSDWANLLLPAWAAAAASFKDRAWAKALLQAGAGDEDVPLLAAVLPAKEREAAVLSVLNDPKAFGKDAGVVLLLRACRHSWSPEFSRKVVAEFKAAAASKTTNYALPHALQASALYCSPLIVADAAAKWPRDADEFKAWEKSVENFLGILQFRHDMLAALKE